MAGHVDDADSPPAHLDVSEAEVDRLWADYAMALEKQLYGDNDDPASRERARKRYGISNFSLSFSPSGLRCWITIDKDRIEESGQLYRNMLDDMPRRPGVKVRSGFEGGSGSDNGEVGIHLRGPDSERLLQLAEQVADRLRKWWGTPKQGSEDPGKKPEG